MQATKLKRRLLLLALGGISASLLTERGARNVPLVRAGESTDLPFKPEVQANLDDTITQVISKNRIPGVVVGIWIPGEGTWITTRGTSNLATNAPMNVSYNVGMYYLPTKDATIVGMTNSDIPTNNVNPVSALLRALITVVTPRNIPN